MKKNTYIKNCLCFALLLHSVCLLSQEYKSQSLTLHLYKKSNKTAEFQRIGRDNRFRIFLNGFFVDPHDGGLSVFLTKKKNVISIRYLQPVGKKLIIKFIVKMNKKTLTVWEHDFFKAPVSKKDFEYDNKSPVVWQKSKTFATLPDKDKKYLKNFLLKNLNAYRLDDLEQLEGFEEFSFKRNQAVQIAHGNTSPPENYSTKMPFYENAYHGKNRKSISIFDDFIIELNQGSEKVVNAYRKKGGYILKLVSNHKVFEDYVSKKDFGYNFIKIDGKWFYF